MVGQVAMLNYFELGSEVDVPYLVECTSCHVQGNEMHFTTFVKSVRPLLEEDGGEEDGGNVSSTVVRSEAKWPV